MADPDLPPPPAGFSYQAEEAPKPPPGFSYQEADRPKPPPGFAYQAEPEGSSTFGAGARGFVRGIVPAGVSLAGMGAGAAAGAPFGPVGSIAGGLIGGFGAGYLAGKGQEAVLSELPESARAALGQSEAQQREDIARHPAAAMAGELIPNLAFVGPGGLAGHAVREGAGAVERMFAGPISSRVAGAGLMGGQEAATQAVEGQEFDPGKIAIAGGAGALLNKPTGLGERVMGAGARPVERLTGQTPATAPSAPGAEPPTGIPVPDSAPDVIKTIAARMGGPPPPEEVRNEVLRLLNEDQVVRKSSISAAEKLPRLTEIETQLQSLYPESSALGQAAQRWSAAYAANLPPTAAAPTELPEPGVPFGYKWSPDSAPQRLVINRDLGGGNVEIQTATGTTAVVPANTLRQGLAADPGVTPIMGQQVPLGRAPQPPITPEQEELAAAARETAALPEIMGQRVPGREETQLTPEDEAAAAAARQTAPSTSMMGQQVPGRTEPQMSPEQVAAQEQMGAMARELMQKAGPQSSYILGTEAPPRPSEPPISPEDAARAAAMRQEMATQPGGVGMIPPEAFLRTPEQTTFTPEELARATEARSIERQQQARQSQPSLPEALAAEIAQRTAPAPAPPRVPFPGEDEFNRRIADQNAFKTNFEATFPQNPRYEIVKSDSRYGDHTYVATPNVGSDAPWRITSFRNGEPTGHMEFNNLGQLSQEVWGLERQGYLPKAGREAVAVEPSSTALDTTGPVRSVRGQIEQAIIPGTAETFPTEYRIRDIRDLIPSHTVDLALNPAADPTLQPRARDTGASAAQIAAMQNRIRPPLLGEIPDATTGAPVTTHRGDVISGNGRVIMLLKSYLEGHPAAETYRNWLAEQGYPIADIEYPVLERVIRGDMDRPQLQQLSRDLNVPGVAAMRASEQARSDAAQIPSDAFRSYAGGDMFSAGNQRFVRAVLGSFANTRDLPAIGETLSPEGVKRVQNAVLAKAYEDPALISKLADDADVNIKAIGGALTDAAPAWAQLRTAIAEGRVDPKYDITNDLIDVANLISRARTERRNIAEYMKQPGLFGEEGPLSPVGTGVIDWMLGGKDWTRAIGRVKIADAIKAYADNAQVNTAQARPSPRELTDIAREQGQGAIRELFSPEMGIAGGPGAVRAEPTAGRPEARGSGDDTARAEAPARGAGEPGVHTDTKADFAAFKQSVDDYDRQTGYPTPDDNVTRQARDYVRNKGYETGHEYYVALDRRSGEVVASGTSNQQFTISRIPTEMMGNPDNALALHHNHPSERSLSKGDNALLHWDGVEWIVAHTENGEIFASKLTPETKLLVTPDGIKDAFDAAAQAIVPGLRMQWRLGKIATNDVEALATHLTNRALDAAGITDYVSTRSSDTLPVSVQTSIVRRAAVAARKAAADNGIVTGPWSDADYRGRLDRSANVVRADEAIARISGGGDQPVAGGAGGAGRGTEGIDLADQTPQRTGAVVGGGYLADRHVIVTRTEAQLSDLANSGKEVSRKLADDLQLKVAPMAQGHWMAQAINKDFANYERGARYQRQAFDDKFKRYPQADQEGMWAAADRASVAAQVAGPEAVWEPLSKLPPDQIAALVEMDRYDAELWARGKASGFVRGDRIPFYTTRAVVQIGMDGKVSRVGERPGSEGAQALDQLGINLTTRGLERRAYLTAEETQAAAQARFGPEAQIFRNVRVVPWAMERFEKALAGHELINKIKQMSPLLGKEAVIGEARTGYFTLDHPAFNTWGPRLEADATGKLVAARDADGNPILEKKPIWISREFEGPLKSVLRTEDGALYRGAMQVKQAAVHGIMISPVIHNMVEWGRSLPLMPGKVASTQVYYEGNALRRGIPYENMLSHIADKLAGRQEDQVINPVMRKAIYEGGFVPGGHRGFLQDITGMAEAPELQAGRGLMAKFLGGIGDVYSPELGTKIKRAVDWAGDKMHGALLWDRIADLQAGIYKHFLDHLIEHKGFDELTAVRTASHLANRYAGFLPNEAMSQGARKLANIMLFSRSYKLGNLGVLKDMFTGLPQDVQAQIQRDAGEVARASAVNFARNKAIRTVMADVALFYLGNAALQTTTALMFQHKDTSDVEREWLGTLGRALGRIKEHPLDALNPFETLASFSPLFDNEPGKTDRVKWSTTEDGTWLYLRSPVGKFGEDITGWITHPLQMLHQSESTLMRPITNTFANDSGFGHKVYDPDAKGMTGVAANVGRIVWEFLRSQTPEQQLAGGWKMLTGDTREGDVSQTFLPFAGLTVSRGYPGGEMQGALSQAQRDQQFRLQEAMPAIDVKIRAGNIAEAAQDMAQLGVKPGLINYRIRAVLHPESRLSHRALQDFMRYATPEQKGQMERMQERRPNP